MDGSMFDDLWTALKIIMWVAVLGVIGTLVFGGLWLYEVLT